MDPDPDLGGQKTFGSGGCGSRFESGSTTLVWKFTQVKNLRNPTVAPFVKSNSDIQVICRHIYMFTLKRNLTTAFNCTKSFAYSRWWETFQLLAVYKVVFSITVRWLVYRRNGLHRTKLVYFFNCEELLSRWRYNLVQESKLALQILNIDKFLLLLRLYFSVPS